MRLRFPAFGREGGGQLRIFIGLVEVAGYYGQLSRGLEELGVRTTYVPLNFLKYDYTPPNGLVKLLRRAVQLRTSNRRQKWFVRLWWRIVHYLTLATLFAWAVTTHDVFIFSFKSSFFYFWDLRLLRALNKRVVYVFHGSDSRPPYIGRGAQTRMDPRDIVALARTMKVHIQTIERYADFIVNWPLAAHFHERPIVSFHMIGLPFTAAEVSPNSIHRTNDGSVRIVHAPSAPRFKGTAEIRSAIEQLKSRGHAIDYVELIGKSNSEVLRELSSCDFVVDQLNGDGPISGFGTEAAFFGKPALNGTHTTDAWEIHGEDNAPLVHHCRNAPAALEGAIEQLIVDKEYRVELGRRAQRFVRSKWTPREVAKRYVQLLTDGPDPSWMFDPNELRYVHGWGPEEHLKETVRQVIVEGGREALQVADKPELERRFIEFAGLDPDSPQGA